MPRSSRRSHGSATLVGLFAVAAVLGVVSGALFAYAPDLPQIVALDDYAPNTITRVEARGGELIGEFAVQRRVVIGYDDIPEVLRQAIIAAEDSTFFEHNGISVPGIVRAAIQDVLRGELFSGASTLTMQLARNVEVGGTVLGREKVWERKLLEMYYAIHLEKRYTKPEILALYANQVWLGTAAHAADGVEAAAQLLFGKSARDVELGEAAVIAGIIQGPSRLSPLVNMDAATDRRNYALRRMAEEDFITEQVAADEMAKPIVLAPRQQRTNTIAPYFIEEIRQHLEREYGARRLYHDGLVVRSTLDIDLQRAANRAVADGLRVLDKRQGYRGPRRNVLDDASPTPEDFEHPQWIYPIEAGDVVPAVVTGVRGNRIRVRAGSYRATIEPEGFAWTRHRAAELVERGDPRRRPDHGAAGRPERRGAGDARPGTGSRGRPAGPRQPDRPRAGDGRRLRLRPQQVQPRDAGLPPARLALQGRALRGGDRPGLHADLNRHGPAGRLRGRSRPADIPAHELRPQVRGSHHAAPRPREVAQRTGGLDDGRRRSGDGGRLRSTRRLHRADSAVPVGRPRNRPKRR